MTLDEIKRAFDPGAFVRGLAYADEGRVLSVTETEPGVIDATVRGTGGVRYASSIVMVGRRTRGDWSRPTAIARSASTASMPRPR